MFTELPAVKFVPLRVIGVPATPDEGVISAVVLGAPNLNVKGLPSPVTKS